MRVSIKACQIRCANSSVWIYDYNRPWNTGEYRLHADEVPDTVRPHQTPFSSTLECKCRCVYVCVIVGGGAIFVR